MAALSVVVGLSVYFLFLRRGAGSAGTRPVNGLSGVPGDRGKGVPLRETDTLVLPAGPASAAPSPLDLAVADRSRELKIRLLEGVDFIFSAKSAEDRPPGEPLQIADLAPDILQAIGEQIRNLKNFRATHDLCRALDDPASNMSDLAKIIVTDPVLSGKILKVANSAYFGLPQKVNSIGQALMISWLPAFRKPRR